MIRKAARQSPKLLKSSMVSICAARLVSVNRLGRADVPSAVRWGGAVPVVAAAIGTIALPVAAAAIGTIALPVADRCDWDNRPPGCSRCDWDNRPPGCSRCDWDNRPPGCRPLRLGQSPSRLPTAAIGTIAVPVAVFFFFASSGTLNFRAPTAYCLARSKRFDRACAENVCPTGHRRDR